MDLRRLRYFVVVAEEQNFSRAAERLHMAQPPLSEQIKRLETSLGVRLFDRSSRGAELTEAGELLLVEARRLLVQAEQTAEVVRRVGEGEVGRLTLGFVPSASNSVLPPVLSCFRRRYPDVQLYLQEMNPDWLVAGLHEGRIDVSFFYLPFRDAALRHRPVSREPLAVALPETHPLADEAEVDLCDLAEEPFVLPARYRMPGLYGQVTGACRRAGFEPRAVQKEVWLMQTVVALVAGGVGVALVPATIRNLTRTGVVYRSIKGFSPTVEMGVVWRREERSAVVRSFLGVVSEVCRREGEATFRENVSG
ncbi:Transcriptional regulator [Rubrobacter radiotolerans]|nr:Transcriptional regulator [Rubrobacter radiotolerans]SMC04425.1 transcriptional regulator, LysR family [Rubrobacter radiotolerans DSM 5868]